MAEPATHVLVLPFPAQGHVIPLMELSHSLVEQGIKVTFVNTEHNHGLILASLLSKPKDDGITSSLGGVDMVCIPDGLADGEDRKDLARLAESFSEVMPGEMEKLIARVLESESESGACNCKLTWIIADASMAWAFPVAKRAAAFNPLSVAMFATRIRIPELIRDGVVDEKGLPTQRGTFRLAPGMPPMDTTELSWNHAGGASGQPFILDFILRNNEATHLAEPVVTNSVQELEPGALALFPEVLTVGPLLSDKPVASFWAEDDTCAAWLDAQPAGSVVYVAFGSFAIFDRAQLVELAEALALTCRPFLWVVRPDSASEEWVGDLCRRAGPRGRVVGWGWCPQQQVLAHASTACFLSHCGWNSTLEGVVNGVPFMCWPYFTDQFLNRGYICDVWRTGTALQPVAGEVEAGTLMGREVIRGKVEELLGDAETKARVLALRDVARRAVEDGGSSRRNLTRFVDLLRGSTS